MTIEEIMLRDGWTMTKTMNAGKEYVEFHKNGLVIDGDGINKEKIRNKPNKIKEVILDDKIEFKKYEEGIKRKYPPKIFGREGIISVSREGWGNRVGEM
jgi:hypothetical protein